MMSSSESWQRLSMSLGSNGLRLRSHLAAGWTSGFCWDAIKPSANVPPPSSPKYMMSSRNRGKPHTRLASIHLLLPLSGGCRGKCVSGSHVPTLAPGCPTAVIAYKIKHMHFQRESKCLFLPIISVLPLYSQSLKLFLPLAKRAEAWQAIPGVLEWVMAMVRWGYTLQFARRPPRFHRVLATTVRRENAQVLRAEVMNLLEKAVVTIWHPRPRVWALHVWLLDGSLSSSRACPKHYGRS